MNTLSKWVASKVHSNKYDSRKIHYLHIGKTAGNQIKVVCQGIQETNPQLQFELHTHGTHLYRLTEDTRYFFSIRHPLTRFRSAFYERKRQGRGGKNVWSPSEAISFQEFEHAVDLAEALFDDSPRGELARGAMHSIQHIRKFHSMWFHPLGHFLKTQPPIWIIRQEMFDHDIEIFARRLGLDAAPATRADAYRGKIADYTDIPELSQKAKKNLERWYSADIWFYTDCVNWLNRSER